MVVLNLIMFELSSVMIQKQELLNRNLSIQVDTFDNWSLIGFQI